MLFEGTCNTALFNDWLEQMLLPDLLVGSLIVMDNATFHKSQKTLDLTAEAGCTLLYLSPYSPDLNPIEKLWPTSNGSGVRSPISASMNSSNSANIIRNHYTFITDEHTC